jgi:transposase
MFVERKQYTEEFKLEAVRLATSSGKSVKEVARDLGINPNMLSRWKGKVSGAKSRTIDGKLPSRAGDVFPGHGKLTSQDEELRQLRRELAIVTEERDILKKATAFFAKISR